MSPLHNSDLCCLELKHAILVLSGQRRTGPLNEPGFSKVFFLHFLSPMELWFIAAVAFGLLSWGHFSGNIVDLIAQTLFEENSTELGDDITESMMN